MRYSKVRDFPQVVVLAIFPNGRRLFRSRNAYSIPRKAISHFRKSSPYFGFQGALSGKKHHRVLDNWWGKWPPQAPYLPSNLSANQVGNVGAPTCTYFASN